MKRYVHLFYLGILALAITLAISNPSKAWGVASWVVVVFVAVVWFILWRFMREEE